MNTPRGANLEFVRFRELSRQGVNRDYHVHTSRTDGKATIPSLLASSIESGLAALAFTEHVRQSTEWFAVFASEVRQEAKAYPDVRVLVGCEAKALDPNGALDASSEILDECDIVLGSVHRFPDGDGGYLNFSQLEPSKFAAIERDLALGLLRGAPIDVLAHPGGMYERHIGPFPFMADLVQSSMELGIAIEINTSYLRDLDGFLALCFEINPFVSVGSDVHRLDQLGECRDRLRARGIGNL